MDNGSTSENVQHVSEDVHIVDSRVKVTVECLILLSIFRFQCDDSKNVVILKYCFYFDVQKMFNL